jgi:hypothetical protein
VQPPSPTRSPSRPPADPGPPGPDSRRAFLRTAGLTGAAGAAALFLAACGDDDADESAASSAAKATTTTAAGGGGDLAILNYALTLEYLEADFYAKVEDADLFRGDELDLVKRFGAAEQAHVEALKATVEKLGGTPVAAPTTKFPLDSRQEVLKLAATVENLGAAAYLGKAPEIESEEVLAAALSIHSVEARHAAALNVLLGRRATPDGAFAKPADEATVLAAVKPFIVA